jgi:hypothetical protein
VSEYEGMTLEELELELQELRRQRAALKAKAQEVTRVHDRQAARVSARHKVEGFTDAEREALGDMIQPDAIPPGEKFGALDLPAWLRKLLR